MGCEASREGDHASRQSKSLDADLRRSKSMFDEIKILLLGIGESGKSTVAKQMKILYLNGFTEAERKQFIKAIHANLLGSMKIFALASTKLRVSFSDPQTAADLASFTTIDPYRTELDEVMADKLQLLWKTDEIQALFQRQAEYFLPGCVQYFFDSLARVTDKSFVPTPDDILRCRVKTTSVIETTFQFESTRFRIVDVGGQRTERRKWIHCFSDMSALLYVSAISEYNQSLLEDDKVIRLSESMELFEELVNSVWFRNVTVILFLNKIDIFRSKFSTSPLSKLFPDFTHDSDVEEGIAYISAKFASLNKIQDRKIFTHLTCATDTECIRKVFESVKQDLIKRAFRQVMVV